MKSFILILSLFPISAWGQLPKPAILADNGIKSVEIWKHTLRPLVRSQRSMNKRKEATKTNLNTKKKEHISSWFFNVDGYPDSCWIFDHDFNKKKTFIYQYDERNRVVFFQENIDHKLESKQKVVNGENGNINCLYWNKEISDWSINYTLRKDSLFIRSKNVSDSTAYYFDDRSTGTIGRSIVKEGKVANRYSERWTTTDDGKPDSVYITFVQFEDTTKVSWRSGSYVQGFKLRDDGSVIPENGRNFYNLNFFKRGHHKTPFDEKSPFHDPLNFLYTNEIESKSAIITQPTFSSVHPRFYREYIYTK